MPEPEEYQYPHQRGEVTPEILAADVAENPDRYHPALGPHIERHLGGVAALGTSSMAEDRQLPSLTGEQITYIIKNNRQRALSVADAESLISMDPDPYYYDKEGKPQVRHVPFLNRYLLLDNLDKFPELQLGAHLIDKLAPVDSYLTKKLIAKFSEHNQVDNTIVHKLISLGLDNIKELVKHFDKFSVLDNTIAHQLIERGFAHEVLDNIDKFPALQLDDDFIRLLERSVEHDAPAEWELELLNVTPMDEDMQREIRLKNLRPTILQYLNKFAQVNASSVLELINLSPLRRTDEEYSKFFQALREMRGLDSTFAEGLMRVDSYLVESCIDSFSNLDNSVAMDLLGDHMGRVIIEHLEKFPSFQLNALAAHLFNQYNQGRLVYENIEKFSNLNRLVLRDTLSQSRAMPAQDLEDAGFNVLPDDEFITEWLKTADDKVMHYIHDLYPLNDENLARVQEMTGKDWLTPYPYDAKNPREKDRWFGDMSYTYMDGGFNKATIGHIIRLRIEQGVEGDIHSASQWLSSFKIPEKAHDSFAIARSRARSDFDPTKYESEYLYDEFSESQFFAQLLAADPELRQRLNFSSKEGAAELLFHKPELQLLYKALTAGDEPLYKQADLSFDGLKLRALQMLDEFVSTSFGQGKEETTHGLTADQLLGLLNGLDRDSLGDGEGQISRTLAELKTYGQRRAAYIRDTQGWLQRHATSPHGRLTKVWADRGRALLEGVPDNARAIEIWQQANALRLTVDDLEASGELAERYGLAGYEVLGEAAASTREELLRKLSSADTLRAMSKLKKWQAGRNWEKKLLQEATLPVVLDDIEVSKDKPYRFDIIGANDPRGFTIGEDTGCCMTIKGESRSCIEAGYTEANAGFVAMYTPSGDMAAQSFWYVHPDHPDTLVLDNIEANEGRDMSKVIDVYRTALIDYLTSHSQLGIMKVHVGTGYTDVDLGDMPRVESIPPINDRIYTDANKQRLMLDLTNSN